jgi:hypothetical protein
MFWKKKKESTEKKEGHVKPKKARGIIHKIITAEGWKRLLMKRKTTK